MKNEKPLVITKPLVTIKPTKRFHFGRWGIIAVIVLAIAAYFFTVIHYYPFNQDLKHRSDFFGISFSTKFCETLGLDWKEVYQASLDELKAKYIRIPVYWDEIEKEPGLFDFSDYDYLLDTGEKYGAKFVLVVGRRQPRWPECHAPEWTSSQSEEEVRREIMTMIQVVVERYKDRDSVEYWQVENEPLLDSFGVCPDSDEGFLKEEVAFVRSLDNSRQIIITGSGELGTWRREAKIGDIYGSTLYRTVYDRYLGYTKYPLSPLYYRLKAWYAGLTKERLIVAELQAEPWAAKGNLLESPAEEIEKTLSVEQFRSNLQYAINLDFTRTYTWGVEWWYYQKKFGNPEYWWLASVLFE